MMKVGMKYRRRDGGEALVERENVNKIFDGLPFIVLPVARSIADGLGLGMPSWYTVDVDGRVWSHREDDYDLIEELAE